MFVIIDIVERGYVAGTKKLINKITDLPNAVSTVDLKSNKKIELSTLSHSTKYLFSEKFTGENQTLSPGNSKQKIYFTLADLTISFFECNK